MSQQANGLAQIISDFFGAVVIVVQLLLVWGLTALFWVVVIGIVLHFVVKYW